MIYDLRLTIDAPCLGGGLRGSGVLNIDWTVGLATPGSPSPLPSPLGRGRMVHRLSITLAPELAKRPSAKHQSEFCCSLSLEGEGQGEGERVLEHAKRDCSDREQGLIRR
jgi:hypothetical protein